MRHAMPDGEREAPEDHVSTDVCTTLLLQVDSGNVVYKTRARRLYDIANALAALGIVEKVRELHLFFSGCWPLA